MDVVRGRNGKIRYKGARRRELAAVFTIHLGEGTNMEDLIEQKESFLRLRPALTKLLHVIVEASDEAADSVEIRSGEAIKEKFTSSTEAGILHLAGAELSTHLPPLFDWWRELGRLYLTKICHIPEADFKLGEHLYPPEAPELDELCSHAPPMQGIEYLNPEAVSEIWSRLDRHVRGEMRQFSGTAQEYLMHANPAWRLVGKVSFHLAENKKNPSLPFAFLATYTSKISKSAQPQYIPLGRALQEFAGEKNRDKLLSLLSPVNAAAEKSAFAKELVENGSIFQPQAWTQGQAYRFLKDIPLFESSGLIVRMPDWWKTGRPSKPMVSVRIGNTTKSRLDAGTLLEFNVETVLDGQPLSHEEIESLLNCTEKLVRLKGQWIEVDKEKLKEALEHWKQIRKSSPDGLAFLDGMRLLAGADIVHQSDSLPAQSKGASQQVRAGDWLSKILDELRNPQKISPQDAVAPGLNAELRPYQKIGVEWLSFMNRLGLGSCLADDMGLGKTIQVLALILRMKASGRREPSMLVVPASLIGNWKNEIAKFAPSLQYRIIHPSEGALMDKADFMRGGTETILAITSYGMLPRTPWLSEIEWGLLIIDEAQAIKNPGTRQTRAVKQLRAPHRIALTGTPVENRLGDLWSIFDFINPGLLGGAKQFGEYAKKLSSQKVADYSPLRSLVRPYILRRLKTDRNVIADLPEKTEMQTFCQLSREQASLYAKLVKELADKLAESEGIARKGAVLAAITRFKQVCNHPSHLTGDGVWSPADSGKFTRLAEISESISSRREKALVFTQFREMTEPLFLHLTPLFRRPGLVLHGQTPVKERQKLVEQFQQEDGPPFLILTVKAGGTGLNLTAASHVIHFDRWWNPAVEDQATDRAFRIGQKKNVLVHKFVCKGTVEEKIDAMINDKKALSCNILGGGEEKILSEMSNEELIKFVSLDLAKATED